MIKVYTEANNIISPLGFNTVENFQNVLKGKSGVQIIKNSGLSSEQISVSYINTNIDNAFSEIGDIEKYTRFEKLAILSINDVLQKTNLNIDKSKTLLILSTTKGNINLLDENLKHSFSKERLKLHTTAKIISDFFDFKDNPIVVSNACISGLAAVVLAQHLIKQGLYDNIIINGTDILSKFVVSGFQSFMSLSDKRCKPFDAERNGLNLGEASASIILTKEKQEIEVSEGSTSNDANHISGPSRTGEGLLLAIKNTIKDKKDIDFISAHGTATPYNDNMEAVAISRAGLANVPTNSLKAYFGHTLGAAGVLEIIISLEALKNNVLINTLTCDNLGVTEEINIIKETKEQKINNVLKLASGFGGGNAAVLFLKNE